LSYSKATASPKIAVSAGNLASALEMGGVDKLHSLGIKGEGIKIGIVDTGVDYRHPALGAGFGPGFKVAGGYRFTTDNGTLANGPDPISTCYGGGHGTHVTGTLFPLKSCQS
jgi:subtilisin family serine protease